MHQRQAVPVLEVSVEDGGGQCDHVLPESSRTCMSAGNRLANRGAATSPRALVQAVSAGNPKEISCCSLRLIVVHKAKHAGQNSRSRRASGALATSGGGRTGAFREAPLVLVPRSEPAQELGHLCVVGHISICAQKNEKNCEREMESGRDREGQG